MDTTPVIKPNFTHIDMMFKRIGSTSSDILKYYKINELDYKDNTNIYHNDKGVILFDIYLNSKILNIIAIKSDNQLDIGDLIYDVTRLANILNMKYLSTLCLKDNELRDILLHHKFKLGKMNKELSVLSNRELLYKKL